MRFPTKRISTENLGEKISGVAINTPNTNENYFAMEASLPVNLVLSDLTKCGVVTILALIFQICLSVYLKHGGWQIINGMLHRIFTMY